MKNNGHNGEQGDLFFRPNLKGMIPSHPHETEVAAAESIAKTIRSKLQLEVLEELREHGPMTDEELEERPRFSHYGPTTVSKRRTELFQDGRVIDTGTKRPNHRGFNMKVWASS